jgi:prepilin-type processing-associated H-X9-DG protein
LGDNATGGSSTNNGLVTATSEHSGGVNGLMGDGAVRFITETIEYGDLSIAPWAPGPADKHGIRPQSGQSAYGVWGALGSKNGGESKQL